MEIYKILGEKISANRVRVSAWADGCDEPMECLLYPDDDGYIHSENLILPDDREMECVIYDSEIDSISVNIYGKTAGGVYLSEIVISAKLSVYDLACIKARVIRLNDNLLWFEKIHAIVDFCQNIDEMLPDSLSADDLIRFQDFAEDMCNEIAKER